MQNIIPDLEYFDMIIVGKAVLGHIINSISDGLISVLGGQDGVVTAVELD